MTDGARRRLVWAERNWLALGGLWTGLLAWLVVVGMAVAAGTDHEPPEAIAWAVLGIATVALVLSVAGLSAVRTRGETAVAVSALALVLAMPTVAGTIFFFIFASFGGLD